MIKTIPSIDLHDFISGTLDQKHSFVAELGKAFNEIGFVAVKNHGLTSELSDELYKAYQKFFTLPQEIKSKYDIPNGAGQRGYTGKGKETAKGFKTPDLKEFYHTGQENKPTEAALAVHYPDNIWPKEMPELGTISIKSFKILEQAGIQLLKAIALYLNLEEDYFDDKVATGNSILRAIHYFPIENPTFEQEEAVRAAAHEDINLITLLMGASADGLQIQKKDGSWVAVTALPDQIVVNVGDMLARLTNDVLKSTTHRVVNPPKGTHALTTVFHALFMHPRADMDLTCLPQCIKIENPKHYTDITAGDFLDERLRELGLKKVVVYSYLNKKKMPEVFRKLGFVFYFYTNEGNEPMHVDVRKAGGFAKFWIEPVELDHSDHFKVQELAVAEELVKDNLDLIKNK